MCSYRLETGVSGNIWSCLKEVKPLVMYDAEWGIALEPLQGNWAFFRVRASWGPFHLRQKTQSSTHIPIAEGKVLLKCFWKVHLPLQSKTENQLSSPDDMGFTELFSSCCTEIDVPLDFRRECQGMSGVS